MSGNVFELERTVKSVGCELFIIAQQVAVNSDDLVRSKGVLLSLAHALSATRNVKRRVLHYFPRAAASGGVRDEARTNGDGDGDECWWCGFHNDHGMITGLLSAMMFGVGRKLYRHGQSSGTVHRYGCGALIHVVRLSFVKTRSHSRSESGHKSRRVAFCARLQMRYAHHLKAQTKAKG